MNRHIFKAKFQMNRLAFAAVALIFCAAPAVYISSPVGWLPMLSLVFAWLLSFLYVRYVARGIVFNETALSAGCIRGADMEFSVSVKNTSRLICTDAEVTIYISNALGTVESENTVRCALSAGEERQLAFTARFEHVGEYSVGLRRISLRGFFGILPLVFENANAYKITVAPKAHKLSRFTVSDRSYNESLRAYTRSSIESVDYAGVRDYAFGDPIKLIHWKLSSHSGGYMTKLLESYGNNGITIIPDMYSPEYSHETLMGVYDAIIETCFSLCLYAKENGLDSELIFTGRSGDLRVLAPSDAGGFAAAMQSMPILHTEKIVASHTSELLGERNSLYSHSNIALCAAAVDEEFVQNILSLRRARKNPILFFVLPDSVYGEARRTALKPLAILEQAGIAYYVIPSADEIGKAVSR